jgi:hypothetical protein
MWLAVLFISLFAPELHSFQAGGDTTTLPLAGIVAASFVFIATIVVGAIGFGGRRDGDPELDRERFERERLELRVRELEERVAAQEATAGLTAGS